MNPYEDLYDREISIDEALLEETQIYQERESRELENEFEQTIKP